MELSRRKIQNRKKTEKAVNVFKKRPLVIDSIIKVSRKSHKSQQGTGIRCPDCGGITRVIRSLPRPNDGIHGRYRRCDVCSCRMFTEEKIMYRIDKL